MAGLSKQVVYDGTEYTLCSITAEMGQEVELRKQDGSPLTQAEFNVRLVQYSLKAGGTANVDFVRKIPLLFPVWREFVEAANFVNGFTDGEKKPGEAEAGSDPAATEKPETPGQ